MSVARQVRALGEEVTAAFQFLTRIPMPSSVYEADSLSRAVKFFPLVGLAVGAGAAGVHWLLVPHLNRSLTALAVLTYFVLVTGGLHEDGLADTADGFGGGWNRDQILNILKDSRIGSYGAVALVLSLLGRYAMLAAMPLEHFAAYVISAQVLSRWSSLPLSYLLSPARAQEGQGARIAKLTSLPSLVFGSVFTLVVVGVLLRWSGVGPLVAAMLVTGSSGWFYSKRLGGVTGDCFGATNQLTEIAVYVCGVWMA